MTGLYFYKLVSPYPEDITKDCKLTINEIDSNFLNLKDADIKSVDFERETKTLIVTRNNGDKLLTVLDNVTYDLNVSTADTEDGINLTIHYDGNEGEETIAIDHLLTKENISSVLGRDILTKVITDNTLQGEGTMDSPLGLASTERTGMYRPVLEFIDVTEGGELPQEPRFGDRYLTAEYLSVYGYLYDWNGVAKIRQILEEEGHGWRVPTKADWDALLNSIEPCNYRNHDSQKCHVELGKYAGKFLKSSCGWINQEECECLSVGGNSSYIVVNDNDGEEFDDPVGVDKYGFSVYPSGRVEKDPTGQPQAEYYKEMAYFWTDSYVCDDPDQDIYIKGFKYNKGGVYQEAECPDNFYSVRLVKDYNGSNYYGSEYIGGLMYNTALSLGTSQVWTTCNFYSTQGFVLPSEGEDYDCALVNGGDVEVKKKVFFINEWNGSYWIKKLLTDGDSFIINTSEDHGEVWHNIEYRVSFNEDCDYEINPADESIIEHVIEVIMPIIDEEREARIEGDERLQGEIDSVSSTVATHIAEAEAKFEEIGEEIAALQSADTAIWEALDAEVERATAAEEALGQKIDAETERATARENEIDAKLDAEVERATAAEEALGQKIDAETERATAAEEALDDKIEAETARATAAEELITSKLLDVSKEYTFSIDSENGGVVIDANSGLEEDSLKIHFDGNLGEF